MVIRDGVLGEAEARGVDFGEALAVKVFVEALRGVGVLGELTLFLTDPFRVNVEGREELTVALF